MACVADHRVEFLTSLGQKISGTDSELTSRVNLFKDKTSLVKGYHQRQLHKRQTQVFNREMSESDLPLWSERPWRQGPFLPFTNEQLMQYTNPKLPRAKSMLRKAEQFFFSRKVCSQCTYM